MTILPNRPALAGIALLLLAACDDGTGPTPEPSLEFGQATLALGEERSGSIVLRNTGSVAVGPIDLVAGPVRLAGLDIAGAAITTTPDAIQALNPGDSVVLQLDVEVATALQAGIYQAQLRATAEGQSLAEATVTFDAPVPPGLIGRVEITGVPATIRQGDVLQLSAVVRDTLDAVIEGATVSWSTIPALAGLLTAAAEFVPYVTGTVAIIATAGEKADTLEVAVEPRGFSGSFSIVGNGAVTSRYTSDLWLHGTVAYTGTWGSRQAFGNTMYVWDVSGPEPVRVDSVRVNARTINDVKIRAAGDLAVITHEGTGATPHAISILDMTDPLHPTVVGELIADVVDDWHGVHNVWIEGDFVYLSVNGGPSVGGLWVVDISDPTNPQRVTQFHAGPSFLHDVYVRDGLAFLSHWNAGLIIMDVGNGIRGGTPGNPVEVSRIVTMGGQVHNAWYWPEGGYVFVGEEDFGTPGVMHVVDVSDLEQPLEVATYRVPGDTPHNFWLDEDRAILYMAWYSQGLHALDVSGRLLGSLDQQGRTIASIQYNGVGSCPGGTTTCTWAPQLHDGAVFVSDMNTGIWKLQPDF